jgi:hypothetical protein
MRVPTVPKGIKAAILKVLKEQQQKEVKKNKYPCCFLLQLPIVTRQGFARHTRCLPIAGLSIKKSEQPFVMWLTPHQYSWIALEVP